MEEIIVKLSFPWNKLNSVFGRPEYNKSFHQTKPHVTPRAGHEPRQLSLQLNPTLPNLGLRNLPFGRIIKRTVGGALK